MQSAHLPCPSVTALLRCHPRSTRSRVAEGPSQAPAGLQLATIFPPLQDANQLANFQFFIAVGMGIESTFQTPVATDFVTVINGEVCTPCRSELGPHHLWLESVED